MVVAAESRGVHLVVHLAAAQRRGGEAGPDLDALHRGQRHQAGDDGRIQLAEHRLAQPGRHAFGDDLDDPADRVALFARRFDLRAHGGHAVRVHAAQVVPFDLLPDVALRADASDLDDAATNGDAEFRQQLPGECPGNDAAHGFARRGAAPAAMVAVSVFGEIGEVCVPGPEQVLDVAVVLGAGVFVADHDHDRRAGGLALVNPRVDLEPLGFLALSDQAGLAGTAALQFCMNAGLVDGEVGREPVDDHADGAAVTLAEGRDTQRGAERVAGHGVSRGARSRLGGDFASARDSITPVRGRHMAAYLPGLER